MASRSTVQAYYWGKGLVVRLEFDPNESRQSVLLNGHLMSSFLVQPGRVGVHTFRGHDALCDGWLAEYRIRFAVEIETLKIRYEISRRDLGGQITEVQKFELQRRIKEYKTASDHRTITVFNQMVAELEQVTGQPIIDPNTTQVVGRSDLHDVVMEQIADPDFGWRFNLNWIKDAQHRKDCQAIYDRYWPRIVKQIEEREREIAQLKRLARGAEGEYYWYDRNTEPDDWRQFEQKSDCGAGDPQKFQDDHAKCADCGEYLMCPRCDNECEKCGLSLLCPRCTPSPAPVAESCFPDLGRICTVLEDADAESLKDRVLELIREIPDRHLSWSEFVILLTTVPTDSPANGDSGVQGDDSAIEDVVDQQDKLAS